MGSGTCTRGGWPTQPTQPTICALAGIHQEVLVAGDDFPILMVSFHLREHKNLDKFLANEVT